MLDFGLRVETSKLYTWSLQQESKSQATVLCDEPPRQSQGKQAVNTGMTLDTLDTLTTSHCVCAGMQESQCTRDSVDCGNVLGTL